VTPKSVDAERHREETQNCLADFLLRHF